MNFIARGVNRSRGRDRVTDRVWPWLGSETQGVALSGLVVG